LTPKKVINKKEYRKQYYLKNKKRIQKAHAVYKVNNKEKIKNLNKSYRTKPEIKAKQKKYIKEYQTNPKNKPALAVNRLKYKITSFGLTIDLYNKKCAKGCELCGSKSRLCLDHDHDSGLFRGILCTRCNTGLGKLGDNKNGILRVLKYLTKSKKNNGTRKTNNRKRDRRTKKSRKIKVRSSS
jgi:hypothetical protein